jgi:hypothetical protein
MRRDGLKADYSTGKLHKKEVLVSRKTGDIRAVTEFHDPETGIRMSPDPGWNYNPGRSQWQPDLDRYDYDIAKKYIEGAVTGPDFDRFLRGKSSGTYPVAVLSRQYREMIGAKSQVVYLSTETLVKNKSVHPEILLHQYKLLPDLIGNAQTVIQDGALTIVFIKRNGRIFHSVVKSTKSGRALFLTSFRYTNNSEIRRIRKKGKVLKDDL